MKQLDTGLQLKQIRHAFGSREVLKGVSVGAEAGELVCLLGSSGSGKSTLLRLAAGLEPIQQGRITIGGELVAEPGYQLPPERRGVGLMFQDFALFPHINVIQNVMFGLRGIAPKEALVRAQRLLERVGMADYQQAYPHTLSGGQQQRVALARALAPEPRVMLLDEPFSGLDTTLRAQVREETAHVLKERGVATLLVTHDPEEAMAMADRIKILGADGHLRQSGTPDEVYFRPADTFVAGLFGPINRLSGYVEQGYVPTPLGRVPAPGHADGAPVQILVRPEGLKIGVAGGVLVDLVSVRQLGVTKEITIRPCDMETGICPVEGQYKARILGPMHPVAEGKHRVAIDPDLAFVFPG
ncbi:Ferric iron ABC transporter, ATP-binding protein [Nitrincola lacisaponensis]|uniref:Ferric iron ABC transporter, ATP-binding protein n=1 Tax=Nitrincola lacisaponensis TaxID=267850 RepID=A0A063Y3I8_9GAMM|nr:ABC transporter ATP-binding protein [Nitrincola lacisaponensis]KDE39326.1 Ferric iron ABC transporter, ATP-binding protein [Nitrincola lacisaponensis]